MFRYDEALMLMLLRCCYDALPIMLLTRCRAAKAMLRAR